MKRDPETTALVLVVDDDPGDQELIRRSMETSSRPIEIRVVHDGEEAIDYLKHQGAYEEPASSPRPDLVLLDLNMPKADGRRVLMEIRLMPALAALPVVVMTTSSRPDDIEECKSLGADAFITKPSRLEDYVDIVQTLESQWLLGGQHTLGAHQDE